MRKPLCVVGFDDAKKQKALKMRSTVIKIVLDEKSDTQGTYAYVHMENFEQS